MAILREQFIPTLQPQPAQLLPSQLRRLQQTQSPQQQQTDYYQQMFQPQPASISYAMQNQFAGQQNQQEDTANRLQGEFDVGTQNAQNLPQPTPVANNTLASTQTNPVNNFYAQTSVRPNIQQFYDQLNSIVQSGTEATGAEEARSAFRQQALLQQLSQLSQTQGTNTPAPQFNPTDPVAGPSGGSRSANAAIGKQLAAQVGWTGSEWNAFNRLVMMESGWNNTAQNPTSTAYGIGQFLDSTWKGYGGSKTSDPRQQIIDMIRYIQARYGDPINAVNFHLQHNWY